MSAIDYPFIRRIGSILNSGETRSVVLTGEVHDLFYQERAGGYVPLGDFLVAHWSDVRGKFLVVYELNGPIRFEHDDDRDKMQAAWTKWRTGLDSNDLAIKKMLMTSRQRAELESLGSKFETNLTKAQQSPSVALEVLRQMCICSRSQVGDQPLLEQDLLILIEGADMLVPRGEIARLNDADRHRVAVLRDWFSDPGFNNGNDSVVLMAESLSQINQRVARLPQVLQVEVGAPTRDARQHCIEWFDGRQRRRNKPTLTEPAFDLAELTAGLSIHALVQLLTSAAHRQQPLTATDVITKVEAHVKAQLGDEVVEFKKPGHTLDDVVGFSNLKEFLRSELIPRFKSSGDDALPGAAVCGPIGVGKTFIFEAIASELDMVVLVLKNIRSKWFGETDVLLERLERVLRALAKVLIFVDEADTQFGGVGEGTHDTERRLTGKIQAMMSDPKMRGRVIWLLMTARIHLLSADIRRPGRVGDLIIPVLDPEGKDREDFLKWMVNKVLDTEPDDSMIKRLLEATEGFSAAGFASVRSELRAKAQRRTMTIDQILAVVSDLIPPAIGQTRRYQTLQALLNCTRRSLLPDPKISAEDRAKWSQDIRELELEGIR